MQWSSMAINWANYFVPFWKHWTDATDEASRNLRFSRDAVKVSLNHGQCQWMLAYKIVGMLSSSYQGPETLGPAQPPQAPQDLPGVVAVRIAEAPPSLTLHPAHKLR
jgi:hypothetical protein